MPPVLILDTVTDTIKSIGEGIISLVKMIGTFLSNIDDYTKIMNEAVSNAPNYLTWLPASVGGIFVTIVIVAIIAKFLGRDG